MIYAVTGAVLFVLVLCFLLISSYKQKKLYNLLSQKAFDDLDEQLKSLFTNLFVPKYNLEYIRLNRYLLENDTVQIDKQFDILLNMKKTNNQNIDIVYKAFNYYLSIKDKEKCSQLLNRIKPNSELYSEAKIMFDILLDNKSDYINLFIEKAKESQGENRAVYYTLVAQQYENSQDFINAKKYQELAKLSLK